MELDAAPELAAGRATEVHVVKIRAGGSWYALPVDRVVQVLAMPWCQPLPDAPDWVLGTFPYGDETVVAVDLGQRLEEETTEIRPTLLVVVVRSTTLLGLVVGAVGEVEPLESRSVAVRAAADRSSLVLGSIAEDDATAARLLSVDRLARSVEGVVAEQETRP